MRDEVRRARVVDEHIEPAERLHGACHHRLHLCVVGDRGLAKQRGRTFCLDKPYGLAGVRFGLRVVDDDRVAEPGEPDGTRAADASGATGNECDFHGVTPR